MTLQARTAQLAMEKQNLPTDSALERSVAQLRELGQGALAEMRAHLRAASRRARRGGTRRRSEQAGRGAQRANRPFHRGERPGATAGARARRGGTPLSPHPRALNNTVIKHAQATAATITVEESGTRLTVTVKDDGVGFGPSQSRPGHLGLTTMHDRAEAIGAKLSIDSAGDGRGTSEVVCLERDG